MKASSGLRPRRGFTLIEVLVSLGIFALAAVVLGSAYVNVLLNYHQMQRWASDRGEFYLARAALLAEPDREKAEKGGEIAMPEGGRLRWTAKLEETSVADLFRVRLSCEITPAGRGALSRSEQEFRVLRPTWSNPAEREKLRTAARERLVKTRS